MACLHPSDLVVVSEAFVPAPETESLSRLLKSIWETVAFSMEDNPSFFVFDRTGGGFL